MALSLCIPAILHRLHERAFDGLRLAVRLDEEETTVSQICKCRRRSHTANLPRIDADVETSGEERHVGLTRSSRERLRFPLPADSKGPWYRNGRGSSRGFPEIQSGDTTQADLSSREIVRGRMGVEWLVVLRGFRTPSVPHPTLRLWGGAPAMA